MQVRTFIRLMLLLLVLTAVLLALSPARSQESQQPFSTGASRQTNLQTQAADGGLMVESFSRHLLNLMQ